MGPVRVDVVHGDHLVPMGFAGNERTTHRATAVAKEAYEAGHRRTYRLWVPDRACFQYDWVKGPVVGCRATCLFCAWLAWSRFRVVIPSWGQTLPTTIACLVPRWAFGAAPTYTLTDNERVITVDRVAGIALPHSEMVAAGRHYLLTCHRDLRSL